VVKAGPPSSQPKQSAGWGGAAASQPASQPASQGQAGACSSPALSHHQLLLCSCPSHSYAAATLKLLLQPSAGSLSGPASNWSS